MSQGLLDGGVAERIVAVARALGLAVSRPGLSPPRALELMRRDKKAQRGQLRFVLPRAIGRSELVQLADDVVLDELKRFAE